MFRQGLNLYEMLQASLAFLTFLEGVIQAPVAAEDTLKITNLVINIIRLARDCLYSVVICKINVKTFSISKLISHSFPLGTGRRARPAGSRRSSSGRRW